jgi:hypothetical protein
MMNTDHKLQTVAATRAKAPFREAKIGAIETSIHLYEIIAPAGEEAHLVGVPTLITALDASFGKERRGMSSSRYVSQEQLKRNISKVLSRKDCAADFRADLTA